MQAEIRLDADAFPTHPRGPGKPTPGALQFPLTFRQRTLGQLVVLPGRVNGEAVPVRYLEAFAAQLAVALNSHILLASAEARLAQLDALYRISLAVPNAFDATRTVGAILDVTRTVFPSSGATVYLAAEEGLHVLTGWGDLPAGVDAAAQEFVARVFQEDKSLVRQEGAASFLAVPLHARQSVTGVLHFCVVDGPPLHQGQLPTATMIAAHIAQAVENTRLLKLVTEVGALRALDQAKTEFVARASHELRTPLTAVKGYVETLLRQDLALTADIRLEFLQGINHATDRLTGLVDEFLNVARIEAGHLEPRCTTVELLAVLHHVLPAAAGKSRAHRFILPPRAYQVYADPQHTAGVLENLLDNAVKYSPEGGDITVSFQRVARRPPMLRISVTDTGVGLLPGEYDKIFERFYRVDSDVSRQTDGAGLGLYICKAYVEAMGGEIGVKSRRGGGCTFFFTLPLLEGAEPGAAARTQPRNQE